MPPFPALRFTLVPLLTGILLSGPVSCSPAVSDMDLNAAQTKQTATRGRMIAVDAETAKLREEEKVLKAYEGPQHETSLKQAAALQEEKQQLETIKSEIESRIDHFTSGAKALRETVK